MGCGRRDMEPRGGPLRDMGGPRGAYASRGDFLLLLLILKNGFALIKSRRERILQQAIGSQFFRNKRGSMQKTMKKQ